MTQIIEDIDRIPDNVLINVIKNSNDFSWNFLAIKIILTRLQMKIKIHKESAFVECCDELRNLLRKSINVPSSREDIVQILSLVN